MLIAAFCAYAFWLEVGAGSSPAAIAVSEAPGAKADGSPTTTVTARNTGDMTAENITVRIEGSSGPKGDPIDVTVDFLAPEETYEITLPLTGGAKVEDVGATAVAWVEAS